MTSHDVRSRPRPSEKGRWLSSHASATLRCTRLRRRVVASATKIPLTLRAQSYSPTSTTPRLRTRPTICSHSHGRYHHGSEHVRRYAVTVASLRLPWHRPRPTIGEHSRGRDCTAYYPRTGAAERRPCAGTAHPLKSSRGRDCTSQMCGALRDQTEADTVAPRQHTELTTSRLTLFNQLGGVNGVPFRTFGVLIRGIIISAYFFDNR